MKIIPFDKAVEILHAYCWADSTHTEHPCDFCDGVQAALAPLAVEDRSAKLERVVEAAKEMRALIDPTLCDCNCGELDCPEYQWAVATRAFDAALAELTK